MSKHLSSALKALFAVALSLQAASMLAAGLQLTSSGQQQDQIVAESLSIVDREGRVRALIEADGPSAMLRFMDVDGREKLGSPARLVEAWKPEGTERPR